MAFGTRSNREPISGRAYAYLKRRILDLTFPPGELLSENRLAVELGLSRTPIREAFKRLESDGLVDVVPQQGTFVSPIRREMVMNAQYARTALECALVHDAARKRSDENLRQLEFNLEGQILAADRGDYDELYRLDELMHELIAAAAGRPAVWDLVAEIKIHMDRARKLTLKAHHAPTLIAQHRAIISAIREQKAAGATKAMRDHLSFVVEHFDDFVPAEEAEAMGTLA